MIHGFTHPQKMRQFETARFLFAEHLTEQTDVSRVILHHENLECLFFHLRGSRGSLTTDSQKLSMLFTTLRNPLSSTGLVMEQFAWSRYLRRISASDAEVVKITTGMLFSVGLSLISARTCLPSFLGRFRSSKIRSGRGELRCSPSRPRKAMASAPSDATCRLIRTLASLNASRVSRTSPGLSSTNRTSIDAALVPIDSIISHLFPAGQSRRVSRFRVSTQPKFSRPPAPQFSCKWPIRFRCP